MDEKSRSILDAARGVFARLGYRKTSMQDIADAAGMSRAALYLRFRNKEDVFVRGAAIVKTEVVEHTRAALTAGAPFDVRLRDAMLAFTVGLLEPLDASGHGLELLAAGSDLAARIDADSRAGITHLLREHLAASAARGEINLPAGADVDAVTDIIYTGACAFKHEGDGLPALRRRIHLFASVLANALVGKRGRPDSDC